MSEKQYMLTDFDNDVEMLEKINEQQSLIQSLKEEIRLLKPTNIEQYEQIVQLQFWNVLTGFCEYVVTDERRIKQLKYDFRPLVLSYWITITDGSDE